MRFYDYKIVLRISLLFDICVIQLYFILLQDAENELHLYMFYIWSLIILYTFPTFK